MFSESQLVKIRKALESSWSYETSVCFNPEIAPRSYGQCAPTAAVIFEKFGGEILKTTVMKIRGGEVRHFYNRIGGVRYDFTKSQFQEIPNYWYPLTYDDYSSSLAEAATEMLPGQLEAMQLAFSRYYVDA